MCIDCSSVSFFHSRYSHRCRLDGYQFYTLVKSGEIKVPSVTTEEINDRSKGDGVTKLVSCLQVSWLAAQLAGRTFQHLPVTTLEIFTLAATVCALTTYGFWWSKPLNVQQPFVIATGFDDDYIQSRLSDLINLPRDDSRHIDLNDIRFRKWGKNPLHPLVISLAGVIVFVFKGCHLIAWNFSFATDAERILWRCAILISLATTLGWVFFFKTHPKGRFDQGENSPDKYTFLIYLLCRAFILVEIFIGLRSVPAGVYKTVDWERYIPHL